MHRVIRLLVVTGLVLIAGWPGTATGQPTGQVEAAVFQLITVTGINSKGFRMAEAGTAFFIGQNGTALTNSHVIYQARRDPARYQLMALVGKEFYGVDILCANDLPYDASDANAEIPAGRDVALIRLKPARFVLSSWNFPDTSTYYAHVGGLPSFPSLTLRGDPAPGESIRVIGYGYLPFKGAVVGERWASAGTVSEVGVAPDGTPVFRVESLNRPRPGNSGSPVLDGQDRVVGMWTWNEVASMAFGSAISSSALNPACR